MWRKRYRDQRGNAVKRKRLAQSAIWRATSYGLLGMAVAQFAVALAGRHPEVMPSRQLFRSELYSRSEREMPEWARGALREAGFSHVS
jgi:hypothetical protein